MVVISYHHETSTAMSGVGVGVGGGSFRFFQIIKVIAFSGVALWRFRDFLLSGFGMVLKIPWVGWLVGWR
jgi:hypothetical protein